MLFQVGSNLMQEATYSAQLRLVPSPQCCLQQSGGVDLNLTRTVSLFAQSQIYSNSLGS